MKYLNIVPKYFTLVNVLIYFHTLAQPAPDMAHTPFWEPIAALCPARLSFLITRPASSHWMMLGVGQIQQVLKWWKVPWVACLSDKVLFLSFFFFCSLGLFTAPQQQPVVFNSSPYGWHGGEARCTCADAFRLWLRCRKFNCWHI